MVPEMLGRTQEPFDLQFTDRTGVQVDGAFLIQVSNNPYVMGATLDASQRRRLDTGTLGVVAISARTGTEAAQVFALSALGQRRRSRYWHEFTGAHFEVRSWSGKAYAGIDGEALELSTPLEFQIHPRAACGCWSPTGTLLPPSDVGLGTSRSATWLPSPGASTRWPPRSRDVCNGLRAQLRRPVRT